MACSGPGEEAWHRPSGLPRSLTLAHERPVSSGTDLLCCRLGGTRFEQGGSSWSLSQNRTGPRAGERPQCSRGGGCSWVGADRASASISLRGIFPMLDVEQGFVAHPYPLPGALCAPGSVRSAEGFAGSLWSEQGPSQCPWTQARSCLNSPRPPMGGADGSFAWGATVVVGTGNCRGLVGWRGPESRALGQGWAGCTGLMVLSPENNEWPTFHVACWERPERLGEKITHRDSIRRQPCSGRVHAHCTCARARLNQDLRVHASVFSCFYFVFLAFLIFRTDFHDCIGLRMWV